jgi:flagellar biosynthesis protein FlhG
MYKTVSFSSGKGGVGKTNLAVNMSLLLAATGKRVLLFDADFGLANIDILINLKVKKNILDFFSSGASIQDIIHKFDGLENNFHIIPGVSGIKEITDLNSQQLLHLMGAIGKILDNYDFLFIDTGAGIHNSVLRMNASSDDIIIIMNPEPTSITDAFALMKTMYTHYNIKNFCIVYNQCDKKTSLTLFENLCRVARNISQLDFQLKYLGYVETDPSIQRAVQSREPVIALEPRGKVARQIKSILQNFYQEQAIKSSGGFLKKFFGWKNKNHY